MNNIKKRVKYSNSVERGNKLDKALCLELAAKQIIYIDRYIDRHKKNILLNNIERNTNSNFRTEKSDKTQGFKWPE